MATTALNNFDTFKDKTIPKDAKPVADMLDTYTYCTVIAEKIFNLLFKINSDLVA